MSVERISPIDTPQNAIVEISDHETLIIGGEDNYAKRQIAETMSSRHLLGRVIEYTDEWKQQGDCSQLEISNAMHLFYGPKGPERKELRLRREQIAKNICKGCRVVATCLEYAITHQENGIWGGTTEAERR